MLLQTSADRGEAQHSTVRFVENELWVWPNNPGGRTRQRGAGVVNPSRQARYFEAAAIHTAADDGLEPSLAAEIDSRVKGKGRGRAHGQRRHFGKQKGKGRGKGDEDHWDQVPHKGKGPPHAPFHHYNWYW